MRPILIDTNAYFSFKRGEKSIIEIFQYAESLAISPVVIGELLSGFECGNKTKKTVMSFNNFFNHQESDCFP